MATHFYMLLAFIVWNNCKLFTTLMNSVKLSPIGVDDGHGWNVTLVFMSWAHRIWYCSMCIVKDKGVVFVLSWMPTRFDPVISVFIRYMLMYFILGYGWFFMMLVKLIWFWFIKFIPTHLRGLVYKMEMICYTLALRYFN